MGKRIGDVLISDGLVSEKTLARALELQAGMARGTKLGAILLKWDLVGEHDLLRTLSKIHRCPAVDWPTLSRAEKGLTRLLSAAQAARLGAMPYAADGKRLRVAFTNPSNIAAVDEVQAITGRRVLPAVASEVRMSQAHQHFYSRPISREMSSVLQKMDSRAALPRPAMPIPPPPPLVAAPSAAPAEEAAGADVWIGEPIEVDAEPAETLVPLADRPAEERTSDAEAAAEQPSPGDSSGELPYAPPDPLSDDGPLSSFLEGALHYYGSTSDLHEALAAIEIGPVEDLEESTSLPQEEPSGDALDETHPSGRFRRRRASDEIAI